MSTDRWQEIKRIFDGALRQAPAGRVAFLDRACRDDLDLRAEVESLLASFDDAESFLDEPAVGEIALSIAGRDAVLESGQLVGQYEVIRPLGSGGMGEIYLARDARLSRQVALKLLPAQFSADADRARRFKREARTASALNHPNIITIYEIDEGEDHQVFIATEYIEGQTLRQHLLAESLTLRGALEITIQVCSALSAAHAAGIVHRDIKPENVMIRPDGIVKVLDFGLAKLAGPPAAAFNSQAATATGRATTPGLIMGTVNYMSPEQARGLPVDGRTDIFSCGVLLYEMLAGRTPFAAATNADTLSAILHTEPPPLTQYLPTLPPELQRIVGKMLRKDQDERYQTAKDLLLDLKELRDEFQVRAKLERVRGSAPVDATAARATISVPAQTHEEHRHESDALETQTTAPLAAGRSRHRAVWFVVAALALGLAAVLGVGGIWLLRARQNPFTAIKTAKVTQLTSWPGLDDFPAISPDGRTVAYCSDHDGSFEIYAKSLAAGAKEVQLTSDRKQNFQPAWSPDGQYIAYYSKLRGGIWVIPASGGEPKQLTEFGSAPAWSPDGATLAFQSDPITDLGAGSRNALAPSTLWLVSAKGGEPKQITQPGIPNGGHGAPSWSPDGKRLAFTGSNYNGSSTWTIATDGGGLQPIADESYAPTFAPGGKSVFYITGAKVQQIALDTTTGRVIGQAAAVEGVGGVPALLRRISFSADGKHVAYSTPTRSESMASLKMRPATSEADAPPTVLVHNTSNRTHMPVFSPDGKRIAYATCLLNGTGCDIWLMNSDGSEQTQLTTDRASELVPSWFPDMEQMAYLSSRMGHWTYWAINLNSKREHLLFDVKDDIHYARLSPDGQQVAYNFTKDGVINVWLASLASGEPKQLTFDQVMMGFPAWSPDGKFLAFQVQRGDDTNVMIMPGSGGEATQLTFDKGQSWSYGWSPDGDKILFAGYRGSLWNVWWVSRTTKKEQQLTNYTKLNSFVRYPSWSPKGDQVVYEYSETTGNIWVAEVQ